MPKIWWKERREKKLIVKGLRALIFLARKQRAHPGFDLHESLITACKEAGDGKPQCITPLKKMQETVSPVRKQEADQSGNEPDWDKERKSMEGLTDLGERIDRGFVAWRGVLVQGFCELYTGWRKNGGSRTPLLVTHGFSAAVRAVLRSLPTEKELRQKLSSPDRVPIPNIFVINSGEKGDLDSLLMKLDLLADQPDREEDKRFGNVAAGPEDTLGSFLDKNTSVMLVLGAECFDRVGRVIHPWGLEDLAFLKELRDRATLLVVVVAEGFKFQEDLLSKAEYFRHHSDRIRLYEPRFVDAFVTTGISMRQTPERRRPISGLALSADRRCIKQRGRNRLSFILRRQWDQDNMEDGPVKKNEFDLYRPGFAAGK